MVDKDRIQGAVREAGGKVERAAGNLAGDVKTQADGIVEQAAGAAQNALGQARDAVRGVAADVPDYVDRAVDAGERYYRRGNQALSRTLGDDQIVGLLIAGAIGYGLAWMIHGRR